MRNPEGLDIPGALRARASAPARSTGFAGGQACTNEDVLAADCDVLIPAALGDVAHRGRTPTRCRARIIIEAANGPTDARGRRDAARSAASLVVPDILANAGGVTVSYFEWVQNLQHLTWDEGAGRCYRLPTEEDVKTASLAACKISSVIEKHRDGSAPVPDELIPKNDLHQTPEGSRR